MTPLPGADPVLMQKTKQLMDQIGDLLKTYPARRKGRPRTNARPQDLFPWETALTRTTIAQRAGLGKGSSKLYKIMSGECRNPTIQTVIGILHVLGYELQVVETHTKAEPT
jgi:hypothetical protein